MTKTTKYLVVIPVLLAVLFVLACAFAFVAGYVVSLDASKPVPPGTWGKDTVDTCCGGRFQVLKAGKGRYHFWDNTKPLPLHTEVNSYGYEGDDYVVRGGGKTIRIRKCEVVADGR
jgi:hypothetical protein